MQKQSLANVSLVSRQAGTRGGGCQLFLIVALCFVAFPVVAASDTQKEPDLILMGTVLQESRDALAIIESGDTGEQKLYRLGDVIEGGRITKILDDSVTLTFSEIEVVLNLTGGGRSRLAAVAAEPKRVRPPLGQTDGGFWRLDRETLNQLDHAQELITNVTSLGAEGVRVDKVKADGLFRELGLQQDDIIRNINGRVPDADLSMKQEIGQSEMGETMLRLEVERQGSMDVVYYELGPASSTPDN